LIIKKYEKYIFYKKALNLAIYSNKSMGRQIDTSEIHRFGILKKGEELLEGIAGNMRGSGSGVLVITNKRFLFLRKPGMFSKGFHVIFECSLGHIISVTITGLISKQLNIQVRMEGEKFEIFNFNIGSREITEIFTKKLIGAKDEFVEEQTIEAKRIVIEEGNKDKAEEILKKRLARGEITLDEFHEKIQRT